MKHWKWIASTALVAVLAIAYGVAATDGASQDLQGRIKAGGNPRGLIFELFDADKNGEVTRAELARADAFDTLDVNGDGVLSAADFPRRPHPRHGGMLGAHLARAADADSSGTVTEAEWQDLVGSLATNADGTIDRESLHEALDIDRPVGSGRGPGPGPGADRPGPTVDDLNAMFSRLDRDGSGVLEDDELAPPRRPRAGGAERGERRGRGGLRGPGPRGPLARADADQSGDVSPEEWQAAFDALDQNGDGKLTRDELHPGPARPGRRMSR